MANNCQSPRYFPPHAYDDAYAPSSSSGSAAGPPSSFRERSHYHAQHSTPHVHPSDLYARPRPPSEAEFHFRDDDTIVPGDSVSQLDRRVTQNENKRVAGPRPMELETIHPSSDVEEFSPHEATDPRLPLPGAPSSVHSLRHNESSKQPYTSRQPYRGRSPLGPDPSRSSPTSYDDDASMIRKIPSPSSRGYASEDPYQHPDDQETLYEPRRGYTSDDTPLTAPLVADYDDEARHPPQPRSGEPGRALFALPAGAGYSTLPRTGAEEEDRSIHPSSRISRGPETPLWAETGTLPRPSHPMHANSHDSQQTYAQDHYDDDYASSKDATYPPDFYPSKSRELAHDEETNPDVIEPLDVVWRQSELVDPNQFQKPSVWKRMIYDGKTPMAIRISEHKKGEGIQKRPWACWLLATTFCAVLVVEMVRMFQYTGSPIQTKPSFNVMVGPSGSVLINTGARFAGCQKYIANVGRSSSSAKRSSDPNAPSQVTDIDWICLKDSNKAASATFETMSFVTLSIAGSMSQICGFGGFATPQQADQTFRFVVPIFLHAGIVHLVVNLLAQLFSSSIVERQMGTPKFLIVYFLSGIFGFVLGSNFSLVGRPSVGASGAIFGTHAAILVDLLAHWDIEYCPLRKLVWLIVELIVGLALGLVPGVDNFAHVGGFCMGLLTSILLLPIIHQTKRHRGIFIALRIMALPLAIALYVLLVRNFYVNDPAKMCHWCRYLSCWPTASNNKCQGTGLSTVTTTTTTTSVMSSTLISILLSTFVIPLLW
ncbi:BQ2448_4071 [Microbotryum intermedium]|uniref:Rhomboid-type serine protease n=1 Tax=Microbotryum intermedium TaxID=269621 RepID=A0A238FKY0_9BASI|nr:BQ2448_4071 [Microbotryum intermedium]